MRTSRGAVRHRHGYTLIELILVTVLGGLVLASVLRFYRQQRFFYMAQRAELEVRDGARLTEAVLGGDLREAFVSAGDVIIPRADSMIVRSPSGFGVVCATVGNNRVALSDVRGGFLLADSVLVRVGSVWELHDVTQVRGPGGVPDCVWPSSPPGALLLRVRPNVRGISIGAPVRAFRPVRYHAIAGEGALWLARTEGGVTERMAGPLAPGGAIFQLIDALGLPASPAGATGVSVRLVQERDRGPGFPTRIDTLTFIFQGRNG